MNISKKIRAKLKRLCPYVGSYIPDSVRENARHFWPAPYDPDKYAGWQWNDGSGFYQCELELCDMDTDYMPMLSRGSLRTSEVLTGEKPIESLLEPSGGHVQHQPLQPLQLISAGAAVGRTTGISIPPEVRWFLERADKAL